MNLLALELSTTSGSLAVFRDGELVAQDAWTEQARQHQRQFDAITEILKTAGIKAAEVNTFAVGRGPGNYTGLRMSMAAAQAMALPGGADLMCVDSGAALASTFDAERVAVVGDARRQLLWTGLFAAKKLVADWELVPADGYEEWLAKHGGADLVVSSDHGRLGELGTSLGDRWFDEPAIPTAEVVGRLALERIKLGEASEPATPLYLQPPV